MDFDAPTDIWPEFELEFDSAETLHDYIDHVNWYVQFLSFSLGVHLTPSEIHISRQSRDEIMAAIDDHPYPGDHSVKYVWPDVEVNTRDLWVGGSPAMAWDDDELSALRRCLVFWVDRYTGWRNAYKLMMTSLGLRGEISPNRLISACKWFEKIPLTRSENAMEDEHVDAIANAATDKAGELGYETGVKRRIIGSLRAIKKETNKNRFSRLVMRIRCKFGQSILPDDVVDHLCHAIRFRGKVSHGHFDPVDEAEFRAFCKSVAALEAFCYLLTALELPIHDSGRERIRRNPVLHDCLHAL